MISRAVIFAALLCSAGCYPRTAMVEHWGADGSYTRVLAQPIGKARAGACFYDYNDVKPDKNGHIRPRKACIEVAGGYGSPGLWEFMAGAFGGVVAMIPLLAGS